MTFCEILRSGKTAKGKDITAYRCTDKYSSVSRYEVVISSDGVAIDFEKCARTTWRKKYAEMAKYGY